MGIFKPTWKKVIISFVVLAVLTIISYFPILPLRAVYYNMFLAGIIILLIISLISGFYIGETGKWFKGILLAIGLLIILTIASVYIAEKVYNPLFGYSCNKDSDCTKTGCFGTAVNKNYISFYLGMVSCPLTAPTAIICEKNKCKNINFNNIESVDFCDRLKSSEKDICYQRFAFKLNDTSFCDKIESISFGNPCYNRLAKQFKDKTICEKMSRSIDVNECIIEVNKIMNSK